MELRVLIVDDYIPMRTCVRYILETQTKWSIAGEAANGLEAVEKAIELRPDVIVLDLNMPVLNGFDAIPLIREKLHGETEILVLTQHDCDSVRATLQAAGARGCVSKSSTPANFIKGIETVSKHEPFFPPLAGSQARNTGY